jgi:hypothetical protein
VAEQHPAPVAGNDDDDEPDATSLHPCQYRHDWRREQRQRHRYR